MVFWWRWETHHSKISTGWDQVNVDTTPHNLHFHLEQTLRWVLEPWKSRRRWSERDHSHQGRFHLAIKDHSEELYPALMNHDSKIRSKHPPQHTWDLWIFLLIYHTSVYMCTGRKQFCINTHARQHTLSPNTHTQQPAGDSHTHIVRKLGWQKVGLVMSLVKTNNLTNKWTSQIQTAILASVSIIKDVWWNCIAVL